MGALTDITIAATTGAATGIVDLTDADKAFVAAPGLAGAETVSIGIVMPTGTVVAVPNPGLTAAQTLTATIPGLQIEGGYTYSLTKSATAGSVPVYTQRKPRQGS